MVDIVSNLFARKTSKNIPKNKKKIIQGYDDLVKLMLKNDDAPELREENRKALGRAIENGTSFLSDHSFATTEFLSNGNFRFLNGILQD